jgi:hypothetical protein
MISKLLVAVALGAALFGGAVSAPVSAPVPTTHVQLASQVTPTLPSRHCPYNVRCNRPGPVKYRPWHSFRPPFWHPHHGWRHPYPFWPHFRHFRHFHHGRW